jgi:hypothetical protein
MGRDRAGARDQRSEAGGGRPPAKRVVVRLASGSASTETRGTRGAQRRRRGAAAQRLSPRPPTDHGVPLTITPECEKDRVMNPSPCPERHTIPGVAALTRGLLCSLVQGPVRPRSVCLRDSAGLRPRLAPSAPNCLADGGLSRDLRPDILLDEVRRNIASRRLRGKGQRGQSALPSARARKRRPPRPARRFVSPLGESIHSIDMRATLSRSGRGRWRHGHRGLPPGVP